MDKILHQLQNYTLLFVENEIGIRENFFEYFSLIFKKVYMASDGLEAYEIYKNNKPNLIITDIKMPNMDGIELVKKIRKEDETTNIIIISAHTDTQYFLQSIPLGLIEYIVKPLNETKLEKVFEQFLLKVGTQSYTYNKEKNEIIFNNEVHILTFKENIFLDKIINGNRIIRYEEIECDIWENKHMSSNALRIFIKNLRKKLPHGFIKNVTNQGYSLGI